MVKKTMLAGIEIRDYQPEDEGSILALVQQSLGGGPTGTRDERYWRWKHLDNPFGSSIALVATNGVGQIVGLRTFMRWSLRTGNTIVRAVRPVDTVTHPQYRRYGIFSELTQMAMNKSRNNAVDLIFNTPNKNAFPGYLKLGWRRVSILRPLVRILNYPRFVAGLIRNCKNHRSSEPLSPDQFFQYELPSMNEFLKNSEALEQLLYTHIQRKDECLFTDQSLDYLRWRYSEYPYAKYMCLYQERNGVLSGCIILRPNVRFGLKEIILDEMLLSKTDEGLVSSLLDELKKCLKADYLITYFPKRSFQRDILSKRGFHEVPRGGQNFVVKTLAPHLPCDPTFLGNWDLSLGDLEIF
jgi:hypothetical protein